MGVSSCAQNAKNGVCLYMLVWVPAHIQNYAPLHKPFNFLLFHLAQGFKPARARAHVPASSLLLKLFNAMFNTR